MPLTTPRELFIHELSDALSAEQQILKMLPELQKEALNHELQEALKTHEEETQQQVRNIQEVFRQLGETPEATTCYAVQGLAEEHKALHKEQPSPEILEIANLGHADCHSLPGADHPSIGFTAGRRVVYFTRPVAAECHATAMTIGQRRRGVGVDVLTDGSVHARVWAHYARSVAIVLEDGPGAHPEPVALIAEERGYFSGFLP